MKLERSILIKATKDKVWGIITDIENAEKRISGIDKVEILEKPKDGMVGLKWRETRTMFGKSATEDMEVTEAKDSEYYTTHAESHGSIYTSSMRVADEDGQTRLTMEFSGEPQTIVTRIVATLTGWMVMGSMRKVVDQDLADIKAAAEK